MEDHKEGNGRISVPAFGEWDHTGGALPDYSLNFTKIREMRKQNKEFPRASIGNEDDLISGPRHHHHGGGDDKAHRVPSGGFGGDHRHDSPTKRKKILSYFNCCMIGA